MPSAALYLFSTYWSIAFFGGKKKAAGILPAPSLPVYLFCAFD
jgi:hypothetical protein